MNRLLLTGAAALAMMTGAGMAQPYGQPTTTQQTTTITGPVAPAIISTSATTGNAVRADGDQTATSSTALTDSAGNKTETTVTNMSYPLDHMITTTRKTTRIVNGVATETVTITNSWPESQIPPRTVTTTTRTYVVGSQPG